MLNIDKIIESKLRKLFESWESALDKECERIYYQTMKDRDDCDKYGVGTPKDKVLEVKKGICIARFYIAAEKAQLACYARNRYKCGEDKSCLNRFDGFIGETKEQIRGWTEHLRKMLIELKSLQSDKEKK